LPKKLAGISKQTRLSTWLSLSVYIQRWTQSTADRNMLGYSTVGTLSGQLRSTRCNDRNSGCSVAPAPYAHGRIPSSAVLTHAGLSSGDSKLPPLVAWL
jgi:hypothetical protein